MKLTQIKSFFFTGLCFASVLANTSLINLGAAEQGGIGIPFFWLFIFFLFPFILRDFRHRFWVCLTCLNFLFLIVVICNVDYSYAYLSQYISRVALVLIFLCFFFFKDVDFSMVLRRIYYFSTFLALLSVSAYFLIIFYNFDMGLYNIANSTSFGFRGGQLNEVNGWAKQLRLTGVWSEPSYLAIPLMMLIYLNNIHHTKLYWFVHILSVSMIIFSFSRSVWLSIGILTIFASLKFSKSFTIMLFRFRLTVVTLIFLGGSLSFILYGSLAGDDSSATGRVGSAIVGSEMIKANPLLGMGPSTFAKFKNEPEFSEFNVDVSNENVIHSAFISIWQQFGILGLVLVFLPYYLVFKSIKYNHFYRVFPYVFTLPAVLVASADFTYFSYYWLFLGVLHIQYNSGDE